MNDKVGFYVYLFGGLLLICGFTPFNYFMRDSTLMTFISLSVGVIFISVAWREYRILKQENKF